MPKRAKTSKIQSKFEMIEKLALHGITTEEQIKKLTPKEALSMDEISFDDISLIHQIQDSVKENKVFSFLTSELTDTVEIKSTEKPSRKAKSNSEVKADGE
ncbi:MAG: hypothetical protein IIX16_06670 [Clostridia bacterium]|nr:hypothetical protein [Clostridia bacterium]